MVHRYVRRVLFKAGAAALLLGCTPPPVAGDALKGPTTGEAFAGVQCSSVRPQTEPDLMAWDPASRLKLNALRKDGVVAVRYQAKGCNVELEVLPCVAGGPTSYRFEPYSANEHKVAHNASELFAQLPVGAARLAGSIKGNRSLRTDYMLAGQYGLLTGTSFKLSDLRGPRDVCERATHVVSAVYVGAFAMAAGESRAIESSVSLLGVGAGGKGLAEVESLGEEGNAEACRASQADAKESTRCAVPLRIGLLALEGASPPPIASPPSVAPEAPRVSPPKEASQVLPSPAPALPAAATPALPAVAMADADNDGVPDARDKCPTQAETPNGFQDEDGCPDELPGVVSRIVGILRGVQFKSASSELLPISFVELGRIATVLKDFVDLRVEIEGHTDNVGESGFNTSLSQSRADAVKTWLIQHGIDSKRLIAKGYGSSKPLEPNTNESNRAKNRRIQTHLVR